jgi:hypothetical protein
MLTIVLSILAAFEGEHHSRFELENLLDTGQGRYSFHLRGMIRIFAQRLSGNFQMEQVYLLNLVDAYDFRRYSVECDKLKEFDLR